MKKNSTLSILMALAMLAIASCAKLPDTIIIVDEDNSETVATRNGNSFTIFGAEVSFSRHRNGLIATLSAPSCKVKYVKAVWKEQARENTLYLGDQWERGYGDLTWESLDANRIMPWYYMESDRKNVKGRGVMTGCHVFCAWKVREDEVELTFDVRNGTHGITLGDRELQMATILTINGKSGENEYAALHRFCKMMCPNPRLPEKPVYGVNDWYFAYGHNSEEMIGTTAELLSDLIPKGDNKPFFLIDDGWTRILLEDGYIHTGNQGYRASNNNFPDMKEMGDRLRKAGFRPGLWMRPLINPAANGSRVTYLDPTVDSVRNYIRKCFATYHEWGYEMVKHDFSTYDIFRKWGKDMLKDGDMTCGDWQFHDTTKTNAEVVLQLYQDIRDAAGDDIYLIGCNTISHLAAGLFELQRIGDDTSGREWGPTLKNGVNCLSARSAQHNAFYAADADCVGLTTSVDWRLTERWLQLVACSGTALFVSAQPAAMSEEQRESLKKYFEIASKVQETAEPLDWMETATPSRWKLMGKEVVFDWSIPEGTQVTALVRDEGPIKYKLYRNYHGTDIPDFSKLGKPDDEGSMALINAIPVEWNEDHFAAMFTGDISIDKAGRYEFEIGSHSRTRLYIDGKALIDNGGSHRLKFRKRSIELSAGKHSVRVDYFDDKRIQWLMLNCGPEGDAMKPVKFE